VTRTWVGVALALALAVGGAACSGGSGASGSGSGDDRPAGGRDLPDGVTLRQPDGTYPAGLPNDPAFFPLGVWLEAVGGPDDVALDRSLGLDLYAGLAHDEGADLDAIEDGGMHLLLQVDEWSGDARADHPAVDGWLVHDEADLTYGPGWDGWTGTPGWNTCTPTQDDGGQCGYTVMRHVARQVPPGALRYANYGLGILEFESADEAEVFVNHGFQDVVSADRYSFTRPDAEPGERRGASYGRAVDRVRDLDRRDGRRQPVWAFVEVGHPFTEDDAPTITAPQVRSAVWHSIVAGARGVVYFNHSFGGPCPTDSVLRSGCDPEMGPAVARLNAEITALAPVLNAPYADGFVTVDGPAEAMAKLGPDGAWYVVAAANPPAGEVTFTVAAGTSVEDVSDHRRLPLADGEYTDTFPTDTATHVYRIT
jgi:hypothetical protein